MTQPPKPRGALGRLLDDAKDESEQEWLEIVLGSGIPGSTIESWISGRTKEPPLRAVAHLAKYLKIPAEELLAAALDGYVPPAATKTKPVTSRTRNGRPR